MVSYQIYPVKKKNFFEKAFNFDFLSIEVWFTDVNSEPIEIESKMKISC